MVGKWRSGEVFRRIGHPGGSRRRPEAPRRLRRLKNRSPEAPRRLRRFQKRSLDAPRGLRRLQTAKNAAFSRVLGLPGGSGCPKWLKMLHFQGFWGSQGAPEAQKSLPGGLQRLPGGPRGRQEAPQEAPEAQNGPKCLKMQHFRGFRGGPPELSATPR